MTENNRNTETRHLSAAERRTVAVVGALYGVRMLGLFMLLPVLALYAEGLQGATLFLAGIAVGAYGLTQALLQIPVGVLSDRYGRVPVILTGLAIFACGSVVAATSTTIGGVIAGRALQGAGAIAAALTALLADATRDELRTRAMAVIGMCIGGSFVVSLVAGAPLAALIGVAGLFWVTAALAAGAMLLVLAALPAEARAAQRKARLSLAGLQRAIRDPRLLELDFGIFILHLILTATFTAVPFLLRDGLGIAPDRQWALFLGAIAMSLAGTVALVLWTERGARPSRPFTIAVAGLAGALLLLTAVPASIAVTAAALTVFFAAFNFLEARLPARLAGFAAVDARGAALGVYASAQFLGVFAGGALGGWLLEQRGPAGVFLLGAAAATAWTASQIRKSGR
ncbi:MAG TPA: MFS transporter [Gammaproteobacteria bacterium]|nr:MFS transporter [Gammaproteobacteria bacterium]